MHHNQFARLLVAVFAAAAASIATAASLGPGEGELDIVAWPGYVERGDSDKAYDWVTPFEHASGCKVSVKTAGTSDEMVALMNQGGYDLVTASGDASLRLVQGKKVQSIDTSLVPSYGTVDVRLQNAPWHTVNGVHYGVPYQWGPNLLLYNTKVFPKAPTSWSIVFEPGNLADGRPNKGRIQAYDGPIHIADAALYLMSTTPALGISNPFELNDAQYSAALALLRRQHPLVHRYWHDANVQVQDFTNEGVVASDGWAFQANALRANKQPIATTVPREGVTGWADTTMLHATARHPNCAYRWMEWSLNPRVQGDVAAWFGANPAVPAACKSSKLLGKDGCRKNGYDSFNRIWFWRTPTATCATGRCIPYGHWSADYVAIKGGR